MQLPLSLSKGGGSVMCSLSGPVLRNVPDPWIVSAEMLDTRE